MISKIFGKKAMTAKEQNDPVCSYVSGLCKMYAEKSNLDTSLEDTVFSVIDTETTGLDIGTAKIINVAAVKVKNFKIIDFYNAFINPMLPIPPESIQWHNITDDMVVDKPVFSEVIPDFLKFIGSSVIVGHHVSFDVKMINKELNEAFCCELPHSWIDTMLLYTRAIARREDHVTLDYLFDVYNVQCNGRHTALGDALATAEVFTKMVIQANKTYRSVGDMITSQKSFVG